MTTKIEPAATSRAAEDVQAAAAAARAEAAEADRKRRARVACGV